jgi:saccharopine dehydrogenase (NAD+, L-lysine-forming)
MKVMLIGVGSVGEAIAVTAKERPWLEKMVLADASLRRLEQVSRKLAAPERFPVERLDASNGDQIVTLARKYNVDLIMNAVTNFFNDTIFDAACTSECNYIDMAMSDIAERMGSYQFNQNDLWERQGNLAILGMGVDPGVSDIFAKYAAIHLFDDIDEIGIRDGAALEIEGYEFAPSFSILDTLEECTDLPLVWERDKGWFTTEPFSEPEVFEFPDGIGPIECVNIEHEEVVMVPRYINCKRVTFKYGLGERFINTIKTLKMLGLDSAEPIDVKGVMIAPRDVVVACLPDPYSLGDKMHGKTCVGTWVSGRKDGKPRQVYLYQVSDNQKSMQKYGCQVVGWQTGVAPVITMELLATGVWKGKGVLCPEAFDPDPYLELMPQFDYPFSVRELI